MAPDATHDSERRATRATASRSDRRDYDEVMPRRAVIRVMSFLLLGAIVNVAVAWACALWAFDDSSIRSINEWPDAEGGDRERLLANHYQGREGWRTVVGDYDGFGVARRSFIQLSSDGVYSSDGQPDLVRIEAGWPMPALTGSFWTMGSRLNSRIQQSIPIPIRLVYPSNTRATADDCTLVPILPLWPGFAINTLLYAATLWLLFAGPFALRRAIRRRRGLCIACGYPIGSSPVCTECGAAVTSKQPAQVS